MGRGFPRWLVAAATSLGLLANPWPHPSSEGAGGWILVSLLVLVLAFALVWGISALAERRHRPPSAETRSRWGE